MVTWKAIEISEKPAVSVGAPLSIFIPPSCHVKWIFPKVGFRLNLTELYLYKNDFYPLLVALLSYYFGKKIPLSWPIGYVMDQSMDEWVRDVCISHQSYWIYSKQPIKFLVLLQIHVTWYFYLFVSNGNFTLLFFMVSGMSRKKCLDLSFLSVLMGILIFRINSNNIIVKNGNF